MSTGGESSKLVIWENRVATPVVTPSLQKAEVAPPQRLVEHTFLTPRKEPHYDHEPNLFVQPGQKVIIGRGISPKGEAARDLSAIAQGADIVVLCPDVSSEPYSMLSKEAFVIQCDTEERRSLQDADKLHVQIEAKNSNGAIAVDRGRPSPLASRDMHLVTTVEDDEQPNYRSEYWMPANKDEAVVFSLRAENVYGGQIGFDIYTRPMAEYNKYQAAITQNQQRLKEARRT